MRFSIAIVSVLCAAPLVAQDRIFHASIDLEQNERLDSLESRLAALESTHAKIEHYPAPPVQANQPPAVIAPIVVAKPTPAATVAAKQSVASVVVTCPVGGCPPAAAAKTVQTKPAASSNYKARWKNYDGLSFEEHARIMHGIDTRGMTHAQIAMARDADHDRYGGGHNFSRSRSVSVSRSAPASGGCPGGVCPTNYATSSRSGWYPGKGLQRLFGR